MSKVPIHHPSSIWEWYQDGKKHPKPDGQKDGHGGVAFVAWPDHVASLSDKDKRIAELENALKLAVHYLYDTNCDENVYEALQQALSRKEV